MPQIELYNKDHLREVVKFAQRTGQLKQFKQVWQRLVNMGKSWNNATVSIGKDFAPYSFGFALIENGKCVLNGGMIYHGPHDGFGDGSAPTFSVSLSNSQRTIQWKQPQHSKPLD